ncbi:hypothetical protein [Marinobacter salicampi]|uniref:hypothetical protein n=1 Tax=Marinobacter salicampi TaxID=435907 RepID=UPI001407F3F3|nr:hypothetical protein [Marinobacter salicampi]
MLERIKNELMGQKLSRLEELPEKQGLYLLFSHKKDPLYLRITAESGFRNRIYNRHVTGTGIDGNSHKLGWGYNVGPFYLAEFGGNAPFTARGVSVSTKDKKLIRKLRARFVREHCRASYVAISKPAEISTAAEFTSHLERFYETPLKHQLSLPWQDNKISSVISFDPELKELIWNFLGQQNLTDEELKLFSSMENSSIRRHICNSRQAPNKLL